MAGIYTYLCYSDPEKFRREAEFWNEVVARIERLKCKDKQVEERSKDRKSK